MPFFGQVWLSTIVKRGEFRICITTILIYACFSGKTTDKFPWMRHNLKTKKVLENATSISRTPQNLWRTCGSTGKIPLRVGLLIRGVHQFVTPSWSMELLYPGFGFISHDATFAKYGRVISNQEFYAVGVA